MQALNKQKGLTLIEVGIALAIGLALIMVVVKAIQPRQQSSAVSTAVQDIQIILGAAADWRTSKPSYTGVSMTVLNNVGMLPNAIGTGSGVNPWAGNYSIAANASNSNKVDISVTNVPTSAAAQLELKLDSTSDGGNGASVSGSTVTVTY